MRRGPVERPAELRVGDLRLDPARRQVWRGEAEIGLSPKEFSILETFMRRPGEVLSRFQLLEHAWDYDYENRSNVVDSYIRLLRRKIDRPFGVETIETVRGVGYRLREEADGLSRLPIRLRVTLVFAGIMAVVLAGTGLFLRLRLEANLDQSTNRDLSSRAADLISVIKAGEFRLGEPVRSVLSAQGASLAQVLTWRGALFEPKIQRDKTGRPFLSRAEVEQAHRGPVFVERSGVPTLGDEPVRMLATPVGFERHRLIVVVGASLSARDDALQSLTTLLLIGGPVALLLASLAAYGTVRAALRPVDAMRRRAAEISAAEAEQRLPLPPASDELRRLGETLNRMLDRLQAAVERERAFVDDASHELRTPLALHKTELELALRYGESPEELRARDRVGDRGGRSSLAAGRGPLVTLARSDKGRLSIEARASRGPRRVRRGSESPRRRRAREAGRSLVVDDPDGLVVEADPARVEQALANLVENGLRHGDGQIRLWARARDDGVELHVSDAGPGFPPEFLPHAFERFRRADTARSESGAGLGLAIVDAIAQAHSGQAAARNAPEGGADVWIELGRAG